MSHPSKRKGYQAEVRVAEAMARVGLDGMVRTGSVGQVPGGPDLVNRWAHEGPPLHMVAVVVPRAPVMFVLDDRSLALLLDAAYGPDAKYLPIYVQVKRRSRFVGLTWWRELVEGVKRWKSRE